MMEFRKLRASEIDCRLAGVNEKYIQLLLYKDARVDQRILDESVGPMNWQRHHLRDNANCVVSIWDAEKSQWIEKEDTGTESYTEAEKGLASDSFKRACFNWGIGRELYSAPDIKLWNQSGYTLKGGKCYDRFSVLEIDYDSEGNISLLTIINEKTKNVVFEFKADNAKEVKEISDAGSKKITKVKVKTLTDKCIAEGVDITKICEAYNIETLAELTESNFASINYHWDKLKEKCK